MRLTEEQARRFSELMRDSAASFLSRPEEMTAGEWLTEYLSQSGTRANAAELAADYIKQTMRYHAMRDSLNALDADTSQEAWMLQQLGAKGYSAGEQAKRLTACAMGFGETEETDLQELESMPEETWADDEWNPFRLKDLAQNVRQAAGEGGMQLWGAIANGMATDAQDADSGVDVGDIRYLETEEDTGVVVAGALERAADENMLPEDMTPHMRQLMAGVVADGVDALKCVANGEMTFAQGADSVMKNAAAASMSMAVDVVVPAACGMIGSLFGPVGCAIGSLAGAALADAVKPGIVQKALEFAPKITQTIRAGAKAVGNKIKQGVKKLLGFA